MNKPAFPRLGAGFLLLLCLGAGRAAAAPAGYASQIESENPYAYYRFGEASGTAITDTSGNGRNGVYENDSGGTLVPTAPSLGVAGSGSGDTAAKFVHGSTYSGYLGAFASLDSLGSQMGSFSGEFVLSTTETANTGLFGAYNSTDQTAFVVSLNNATAGSTNILLRSASGDSISLTFATPYTGSYFDLAFTFDAADGLVAYVNGVAVASGKGNITGSDTFTNFAFTPYLGASNYKGNAPTLAAVTVDEMAFFTTALSSSQIAADYGALAVPEPSAGGLAAGALAALILAARLRRAAA